MRIINGTKMNSMVWKSLFSCALIATFLIQSGCKCDMDEEINAKLSAVDRTFVDAATQSNLSEIGKGNLALQKALDTDVKSYAQMMVDMHTTVQNELKQLGINHNFTIADRLDEEHQSLIDQLAAKTGADFDKAYMNGQVTGHHKTSALMQNEMENGQKSEVKAYATKSKDTMDSHLSQALQIKTTKGY
jgi:putative membrane protein